MKIALYILSILITIGTFVPYLNAEHWLIRGQDYIKIVYFILGLALLILVSIFIPSSVSKTIILIGLIAAIFYCLQKFIPLTPIFPIQLPTISNEDLDRQIKLLVYNVYQKNESYSKAVDLILREQPDIAFLLETDDKWDDNLHVVYQEYPHVIKSIRNDTYGLVMLSKIELVDSEVKHVITDNIPSMEMEFIIAGQSIKIYGLHPEPPILGEALYSSKKDKEFQAVAKKIKEDSSESAYIAMGDFNEVSWGRTFKHFWKTADMLDPRRGRYIKPTFPTYLPIKIPLDHILCSSHFELVSFDVLENIGSDHLPIQAVLQLK